LRARRFRRYAIVSAVQLLVCVALSVTRPADIITLALGVAVAVPALWAWWHAHADLSVNPDLDDVGRTRWRLSFAFVPGAIAAYWLLYVR
jgi:hypothetical protein